MTWRAGFFQHSRIGKVNTATISVSHENAPLEEFRRLGLALVLSAAAHLLAAQWLPQSVKPYDSGRYEYSLTVTLAPMASERSRNPIQQHLPEANPAFAASGTANGARHLQLSPSDSIAELEPVRESLQANASQESRSAPALLASGNARDTASAAAPDRAPDTLQTAAEPAVRPEIGAEEPTESSNSTLEALDAEIAAAPDLSALPLLDYYYASSEVDQPARAVGDGLLQYPREALRLRIAGQVKLRLFIDEYGALNRAEVVSANPSATFEAAALEAVHSMRFSPARKGGQPVRSQRVVEIAFDPDPGVLRNMPSSR
jgi:TonB family protein